MNLNKSSDSNFTSSMTTFQTVATLLWLVVHVAVLGWVILKIPQTRDLSSAQQNLIYYGISTVVLVIIDFSFLRRDYETLMDHFGRTILEILRSYALIIAFDLILSLILSLVLGPEDLTAGNENNQSVIAMAENGNMGMVKAAAIFLAPIAEELMFRGALFGSIRKKNRLAAYLVSMVAFAVYHVWAYAIDNPVYWLYTLQYIPTAYVICRCYEQSDTIWASIFFHMIWNAVSFSIIA